MQCLHTNPISGQTSICPDSSHFLPRPFWKYFSCHYFQYLKWLPSPRTRQEKYEHFDDTEKTHSMTFLGWRSPKIFPLLSTGSLSISTLLTNTPSLISMSKYIKKLFLRQITWEDMSWFCLAWSGVLTYETSNSHLNRQVPILLKLKLWKLTTVLVRNVWQK